jgi:hypothetical protein
MKWQTVLKGMTLVGVAAAIVGCRTEPQTSLDVVTADIVDGTDAGNGKLWTDPETGVIFVACPIAEGRTDG